MDMQSIPTELINLIVQYTHRPDVYSILLVNKRWNSITNAYMRDLYGRHKELTKNKNLDLLDYYVRRKTYIYSDKYISRQKKLYADFEVAHRQTRERTPYVCTRGGQCCKLQNHIPVRPDTTLDKNVGLWLLVFWFCAMVAACIDGSSH
jgi:hypothetical protein